jgi:GT2 family glycosyltransferase
VSRQLPSQGARASGKRRTPGRAAASAEDATTRMTPTHLGRGELPANGLEHASSANGIEDADTSSAPANDPGPEPVANGAAPSDEGEAQRLLSAAVASLTGAAPDPELLAAEVFDEAGYLRLNPDVRRAVEMGQIESGYAHYCWNGRAEGRALPDSPREARNTMLLSQGESERLGVFPKEARCSIEALIISARAGLMIVGWIDDVAHPLSCIRIIGPDWRVVIDTSHFLRVRRADVEKALGARNLHAFGFMGFLHFDRGGATSGTVQVELWQAGGFSTTVQLAPTVMEDVELRDTFLAHVASATYFGNPSIESIRYLERGLGAELVRFNLAITRRVVSAPYVEYFGPQGRPRRGSIVVCLYGKPEYFFLQNSLYSNLPGIDEYEFVYVSNSPEMAETLLREAQRAKLLYGLPITVVILTGNAGFGAANNVAARVARTDRLLIVNPDVFPRDRDWARKHSALLETAPPEQTRLFGVPLYYDDGSLMHGGMYFEIDGGLSLAQGKPAPVQMCRTEHYGKGAPAGFMAFNRPRPVPAISGAFISAERGWYERLGGFTEDFIFGHYEDADLCLKSIARGTAPWIHDIRLWHLEGKGSTRRPHHEGGSLVNRWLFSSRWMTVIADGLLGPNPSHALMQPGVPSELPHPTREPPLKAARPRRARP